MKDEIRGSKHEWCHGKENNRGDERTAEDNMMLLQLSTKSKQTLAISCMLKGPFTSRARAIAATMEVILARVSELRSCGGVTSVASPECTPAFSTCSLTAMQTSAPSAATASTSISCRVKECVE